MIHIVIGTRAQLIKMAPVIRACEQRGAAINLVFTGQHSVTMEELLADFEIRTVPRLLYRGREVSGVLHMGRWFVTCLWRLLKDRREWFGTGGGTVVVHGDTMSTLLGALAGRACGRRVAHVEAGLRSFRLFHPFPEELTRLAVSRLCQVAYCPGPWAVENLRKTSIQCVDTDENTLRDAVAWARARAALPGRSAPYFITSIHRFENLARRGRFESIIATVERLTRRARCVFVMHPITEARLRAYGLLDRLRSHPRIELRPRMRYTEFVGLLGGASFVVTDGGSNQEELYYLGVPTILMRRATERQEGLGQNVLLSHYDGEAIETFLDRFTARAAPAQPAASPSARIADHLVALGS